MQEIWKDIYFVDKGIVYDYRGLYQVSTTGEVKSLNYRNTKKEKILKKSKRNKYFCVALIKDRQKKLFSIHRLVAFMFIPNPKDKPCINHKNENTLYNYVENLEWCTYEYNNNYGTHKEKVGKSHWKKVNQYDKQGNFIKQWESLVSIEKELNFDHRNVSACCRQKYGRPTAYNYIWRYAVED